MPQCSQQPCLVLTAAGCGSTAAAICFLLVHSPCLEASPVQHLTSSWNTSQPALMLPCYWQPFPRQTFSLPGLCNEHSREVSSPPSIWIHGIRRIGTQRMKGKDTRVFSAEEKVVLRAPADGPHHSCKGSSRSMEQ